MLPVPQDLPLALTSASQTPMHLWHVVHWASQAPQFALVSSGVQVPPQQPCPAGQAVPQAPQLLLVSSGVHSRSQQPSPFAQACPQEPQLLLVSSRAQVPEQQACAESQVFSHPPQFLVSVCVFTQAPLQQVCPA